MQIDILIFQYLNGFAYQTKILDALGIFFGEYLAYLLGIALLVFLFWPRINRAKNQVMVIVAFSAGVIARFVVKTAILLLYNRARPFMVLSGVHQLISTSVGENFQSFPSGHAVFFFSLAMTIYSFNKKLGAWFFLGALAMGLARVFAGVHWPSDILGGAIIGIATGWLIYRCYHNYHQAIDATVRKIFETSQNILIK